MKRFFITAAVIIVLLMVVIVVRTLLHQPPAAIDIEQVEIELNETELAQHLSESIQFQTVSFQSPAYKDRTQFTGFYQAGSTATFNLVHERLEYLPAQRHNALSLARFRCLSASRFSSPATMM